MRVLILEPHANGHYSSYLQWMTAGPIKRGLFTYVGAGGISIGNNVLIAGHEAITSLTHDTNTVCFRETTLRATVGIGENVGIGAAAIILPGVTVGAGTIVAAGGPGDPGRSRPMLWWRERRRGWWAGQDNLEKVARPKHATKKQGSRLMSAFLTPDPSIPYSRRHPCSRVGVPVEIRLRHRSQWPPSFAGHWPGKGSTQMDRTRGHMAITAAINIYLGFRSPGGMALSAACFLIAHNLRLTGRKSGRLRPSHLVVLGTAILLGVFGLSPHSPGWLSPV